MKELSESFIGKGEVAGFQFNQLKKGQNAYLYSVSQGNNTWYEVFKRKINNWDQVSYPRAKSFGLWAKTTFNQSKALEYFSDYEGKGEVS